MAIDSRGPRPAHVIVLGNEKGGSGKSTTAMHVIVALLNEGARVASIDTDGRQRTLTRYLENRAWWSRKMSIALAMPKHFAVPLASGELVSDIEGREFRAFAEAISRAEHGYDFVVVDTPGSNSYLMRVSHAMADTLITPINDSFIDFDVLAKVDPETFDIQAPSHYAELVADARKQRELVDDRAMDWVIVRNRLSTLDSRNRRQLVRNLETLSGQIGFRIADGISERLIFRELFPRGLTALDKLDKSTLGSEPTLSHLSARREIRTLIDTLNLPTGRKRGEQRPLSSPANDGGSAEGGAAIAVAAVASGGYSAT
jgi:chromosome partitioning protein